jgi:MFS family permease
MTVHLRRTFAALLVSRNYRRYFAGQSISLAGTWMQTIAQGWLVLQLSGSGTAVGLVTAFQFVPVMLLGPLGGVVVDRLDKRRLLLATQVLFAAQALLLGVLTATGTVELWMVYVLAAVFGLITVVDNPARQTFILELVGPAHLTNAVTLNSVNINAARIVGPAFAAALIALFGIAPSFFVNALSYGALVVALLLINVAELHPTERQPGRKGQLREGLAYVWHTPELRVPLVMMALIGTLAYEFQVILPIAAKFTFGGTAGTYGLLTAAMGVGAVIGGLLTASRNRYGVEVLARQSLVFGVLILAVAVSPTLPVALVALVGVGAASITFLARANSTMQLCARPELRGRVMALWTVAFLGTTPIGGPIIGWIGEHLGARWGLATGAASCFGAAAIGWRQRSLDQRPTGIPAAVTVAA